MESKLEQTDKLSLKKIDEIRSPFPLEGEVFGWGGNPYYALTRGFLKTDEYYAFHAHGRNPAKNPTHPPNLTADGAVYVLDNDMNIRDTLFSPEKLAGEGSFGLNLLSANGCLFITSTVYRDKSSGGQYDRIYCFSESDLSYLGALDGPSGYSTQGLWNEGNFLFVRRGYGFEIWHSNPSDPKFGQRYTGFQASQLGGPAAAKEFLVMAGDRDEVGHRKYHVHRLDLPESDGLSPRIELANPFLAFGKRIGTVNQGGLLSDDWLHFSSNPEQNPDGTRDGWEHFVAPAPTSGFDKIEISHHLANPAPDRLRGFGHHPLIIDSVFLSVCSRHNSPPNGSNMTNETLVAFDLSADDLSEFSVALETEERIGEVAILGDHLLIGFHQRYGNFGAIDVFEMTRS